MSGWPLVRLGDVCDTTSGGTPDRSRPEFYGGDIPWVKSGDLNDGFVTTCGETLSELGLKNSSAKRQKSGTLLIAMYGATVGRLGILGMDAATNQAVCAIKPSQDIDLAYLFQFLLRIRPKLVASGVGGAQPNISQGIIRDLRVPLPPLDEQRRIAAILDKADAIRRKRQQALALADDFLRSAFLEMFGSPVRNSHGWDLCPIGECVTTVDAGWSAKGLDRPATPKEFGVLKVSAVTSGRYRPSENKAVEGVEPGRSLVIPRQGDFLFSRANTRELVAATCIVDRTVENVFLPDKLWRIRLDKSRITPEYLKFVLSDPVFRSALCAKATGTSGSMLNISQGKLLETPLPLPPVERQRSFSALVQKTEAVRAQSAEARSQAETLFASLSQRAFRGDLLPAPVPA